jgi:hypothetical protein
MGLEEGIVYSISTGKPQVSRPPGIHTLKLEVKLK